MRLLSRQFVAVTLTVISASFSTACHKAQTRNTSIPAASSGDASGVDVEPVRDANWQARAAVVHVDPGNSVTKRRSESTFSTRTSSASVDSHTSSLLVQVAALKHTLSIKQPRVEQQLRDMGLQVVGLKRSRLRAPNDYNVLVEDVTYVEESDRKNAWDPVTYTMTPAIHVRIISANERTSLEGTPITVKVWSGNLTAESAENYGRKLALARTDLAKQLVTWLETRLHATPASPAAPATNKPAEQKAAQQQAPAAPNASGNTPTARVAHAAHD
jgi:hypothetical protein